MKTTWVLFEKVWLLTRFNEPLSVLYDKLIAFKCYRLSNRIFVIDEVSETTQTRIVRTEIMLKPETKNKQNQTKQNTCVFIYWKALFLCVPYELQCVRSMRVIWRRIVVLTTENRKSNWNKYWLKKKNLWIEDINTRTHTQTRVCVFIHM